MPAGLEPLAPGVFAWLGAAGSVESPNVGVVLDEDGFTLIDSLLTPDDATPLVDTLAAFDRPIRRLILTGSHIDRTGGSTAFPFAAVYGTRQTNALLEQPPNVEGYRRLYPGHATAFDDGFTTRRVTHIVDSPVQLTPAVAVVPTSGQAAENLVALSAASGVCFGGAMLTNGVTPLAFDGDPAAWADALDGFADFGSVFVPGYGPVMTADQIGDLAAYLRACVAAEGDHGALPAGPWDAWSDRDRDEVNVERAALLTRGIADPPPSMLRRLGL